MRSRSPPYRHAVALARSCSRCARPGRLALLGLRASRARRSPRPALVVQPGGGDTPPRGLSPAKSVPARKARWRSASPARWSRRDWSMPAPACARATCWPSSIRPTSAAGRRPRRRSWPRPRPTWPSPRPNWTATTSSASEQLVSRHAAMRRTPRSAPPKARSVPPAPSSTSPATRSAIRCCARRATA